MKENIREAVQSAREYCRKYLKSRLTAFIFFGLASASFYAVLILSGSNIPEYAVKYGLILAAFFAAAYIASDLFKYMRRVKYLKLLQNGSDLSCDDLPAPLDDIHESYDELIRRLLDSNAALRDEADKRLADMSDYYTMWAHQIKTPIAAMKLILQTENIGPAAELSESLRSIELYVETVMCYIRLESDSSDYIIKEYDIDRMVSETVKKFSSQFIRKKIRLIYEPTELKFYTDSKWFEFVLDQIISNSLKYTNSGYVKIYAEGDDTLCIADTGRGIAPEDLPRIFEKGYTGCNGRAERRASGLGLYLCKTVCSRLGHGITALSDENGTTVKICAKTYDFTGE